MRADETSASGDHDVFLRRTEHLPATFLYFYFLLPGLVFDCTKMFSKDRLSVFML